MADTADTALNGPTALASVHHIGGVPNRAQKLTAIHNLPG